MSKGRTYGKLSVDIWQDMVDLDLSRDARQLFPMLVAQKKASLCGALDMRIRPWARYSGMTVADVEAALEELCDVGWVAIDWDTEEVVLCGFVQHDLQISNQKHRLGMWRALRRVESKRLRDVIVSNLPPEIYTFADAGTVDGEPEPDPEPPPEGPTDCLSDWSIEGPTDCLSDSPGTLNPEPGTLNQSSSSPRESYQQPVDKPVDDDWIYSHAKQHLDRHIEHRGTQIENPRALARSQLPKIIDTIRDELATGADRYDIDDVLEREWPTIDHAFNPQPSAAVRRVQTAARALKVVP